MSDKLLMKYIAAAAGGANSPFSKSITMWMVKMGKKVKLEINCIFSKKTRTFRKEKCAFWQGVMGNSHFHLYGYYKSSGRYDPEYDGEAELDGENDDCDAKPLRCYPVFKWNGKKNDPPKQIEVWYDSTYSQRFCVIQESNRT